MTAAPPPGWSAAKVSREDRYQDALAAIRTLDCINKTALQTNGAGTIESWLRQTWESEQFNHWWPGLLPAVEMSYRSRQGWSITQMEANSLRSARLEISTGPMTDVELATVIGCIGRMIGLMLTPVNRKTFDRGTVTIATAALLVHNPARAKEFWDLMAAVGIPGSPPPENSHDWKPETWVV